MTSHTAEYWFIQLALSAHARSFSQLEKQMNEFRPVALDAFKGEWQAQWAQMRPINAEVSDEELKQFIDNQIAAAHSAEMQFIQTFMEPFAAEAISITILAHALIEATINAILAIGLAHIGKPTLFSIIEQAEVKQKWIIGPQAFLPSYIFPRSGILYEGLTILCRRRNAYVHSNPDFSQNLEKRPSSLV